MARGRQATAGEIFEIDANELEWTKFASEERQMGPEIGYSAVVKHSALGQLTCVL